MYPQPRRDVPTTAAATARDADAHERLIRRLDLEIIVLDLI
ncbi:hypothetical protein RBS60_12215 [Sinomonas sp. ASV486]|nr:hypothetical protein [Sinomonas sp. ASV486]MDQ4490958.1 hypothetical protein [Sinomonas sp. ASV486]